MMRCNEYRGALHINLHPPSTITSAAHERRLEVHEPRWADLPARCCDGQAQLRGRMPGCVGLRFVAAIFTLGGMHAQGLAPAF